MIRAKTEIPVKTLTGSIYRIMRSRLTFFVALYLLAAFTLTASSALLNQRVKPILS